MTPALGLALLAVVAPPPSETAAAREQARLCERFVGEESLAACRRALALGLGRERRKSVRQIVARRLASLERWPELAEHFRGDVAEDPLDNEARLHLGSTLLFALGRNRDAVEELEVAARLQPGSAEMQALLAVALCASGRPKDAAEAFEEAVRLDEHVLDHRPALQATLESVRRGEAWP